MEIKGFRSWIFGSVVVYIAESITTSERGSSRFLESAISLKYKRLPEIYSISSKIHVKSRYLLDERFFLKH